MLPDRPASPARSRSDSRCADSDWRVRRRIRDDQSRMRPAIGKFQKVISVAGEHQPVLSLGILKHLLIDRFDLKNRVQFHCVMALSAKRTSNRCGNIVIEEEAHESSGPLR